MKKKSIKKEQVKKIRQIDQIFLIVIRYIILLALMFSLPIIYKIITPITIYTITGLLKLIYTNISLTNDIISINSETFIQIIPACIAGSAYLLLLILNLTVPMGFKKRIYSVLLSFIIFFLLNILRIILLTFIYQKQAFLFDFLHKLFWLVLSTLFVIGIWFLIVKIFSIKQIPIYSDIKYMQKRIKSKK